MALEWENNLSVFGFIQGLGFRKESIFKKRTTIFFGYS
jgi:hypothetical protein